MENYFYFRDLTERIAFTRDTLISRASFISGEKLADYEKKHSDMSVEAHTLSEDFAAFLTMYEASGYEYFSWHNLLLERKAPWQGQYHRHEFIEILYVAEGSFDQILLGEHLHFEQGEFVITDQNCEHADYILPVQASVLFLQIRAEYMDALLRSYDEKDELQRFLFHALSSQKREQSFLELKRNGELFEEAAHNNGMLYFHSSNSVDASDSVGVSKSVGSSYPVNSSDSVDSSDPIARDVRCLLEQLLREFELNQPGYAEIRKGLLLRLLHILCNYYSPILHAAGKQSKEKAALYEIERFIRLHEASVTTAQLEQVFHYHRNYYGMLLQKYRGMTFMEYLLDVRLSHAAELLASTDLPIRQIALEVGYENKSHFYSLFKKKYGCGPNEYREGRKAGQADVVQD